MESSAHNRAEKRGVEILHMVENVRLHRSGMEFDYEGERQSIKGIRFTLPDNESRLVFYPWPSTLSIPTFPRDADYENIKMGAMVLQQPRRTLNYGVSYLYSQTYHKLEDNTPEDIQNIMDYTAAMYTDMGSADTTVMCLANKYQTGRHYISKQIDIEFQVSHIHDIICWVTGAPRRIIIRPKKSSDKVLEVRIPQGIYIMRGDVFQKNYTHEIPKESDALFKKLQALVPDGTGVLSKHVYAADWLANHPKAVAKYLPDLYAKYVVWSQERCSYTIRFFDSEMAFKQFGGKLVDTKYGRVLTLE